MNLDQLVAIDVHTHAEHSCRQPHDPIQAEFDAAATLYFKTDVERPTIAQTIEYYRERKVREPILKGNAARLLFGIAGGAH